MKKVYSYPVIFAVEDHQTKDGDFPVFITIPDLIDAGFVASSGGHTEDDIIGIASNCMKNALENGIKNGLEVPSISNLRDIDVKRHLASYDEGPVELKSITIEWIKAEV
ncbi:hypothetical protein CD30_08480 [Ureibacillus massiliensis 4400831 = CIP 108448 = CCUG 49529]|uniref:HicB-like antitoxin of toxin-antitoxin system domain-containing protein n=1 Tax=Ureibacillus massiliensis 4400831 = CIP 108448 = CCUG 49529 TaxID=1211035 RepID=A0A0A3JV93_9BACL|nr:hypothetical protein [Ureibacillus massiliensis]KGR90922.1 hypothetical protein CD30_08480 [Ureibacillus massiliensis 4400831 = CIP 108448 = CCUG 49529]